MVYFIQDSGCFAIKIGYAKSDLEARRTLLQTGNPSLLIVLLSIDGEREREHELHRQFAKYRGLGEWFQPAPDLLFYIMGEIESAAYRRGKQEAEMAAEDVYCSICTGGIKKHIEGCPVEMLESGNYHFEFTPIELMEPEQEW